MEFKTPSYEWWAIVFTAIGSTISYAKMSNTRVKAWALSFLFDRFFGDRKDGIGRIIAELAAFVICGVLVGIGVTQPTTVIQALTAGLGWTALLVKHGK